MTAKMVCPQHGPLSMVRTKYGPRWSCPADGCTVVCWGSDTSTPADQETRDLRHQCHAAFDPLWQERTLFDSRGKAYRWLARTLGLSRSKAHIGMLDAAQCERLLGELQALECGL